MTTAVDEMYRPLFLTLGSSLAVLEYRIISTREVFCNIKITNDRYFSGMPSQLTSPAPELAVLTACCKKSAGFNCTENEDPPADGGDAGERPGWSLAGDETTVSTGFWLESIAIGKKSEFDFVRRSTEPSIIVSRFFGKADSDSLSSYQAIMLMKINTNVTNKIKNHACAFTG